jgi:hypothetical protein
MSAHFTTSETPEEREIRRRRSTARRIRTMVVIFGVAVTARIFIKNPPPPKTPDYSKYKVRYVPGMLDAIPASERSRMDPKILAQIQQTDVDARNGRLAQTAPVNAFAKQPYKAAETPLPNISQEEKDRQFAYVYEKRREERMHQLEEQEIHDTTKSTVVEFLGGGYLRVEKAAEGNRICEIKVDRKTIAAVPARLVKNVRPDAAEWTPPLSKNQVQLKPARGITIVIGRNIASRITMPTVPLQ